jgi:hypothetical protein
VNLIQRPDSDFAVLGHRDAKNQKNFFKLAPGVFTTTVQFKKVFARFFQKALLA